MREKVVIIGAGAHSHPVIDLIQQSELYEIVGVTDRHNEHESVMGIPFLGDDSVLPGLLSAGITKAFVAIGDNTVRRKVSASIKAIGFTLINVISDKTVISSYCEIGEGVLIMPGVVVNANSIIGDGVILNTSCSVDHDCTIGAFCLIAPGVTIAGSTKIGQNSLVGTGCAIIDRLKIGENVIIGAGAVVIRDIDSNTKVAGVPAKEIGLKG